MKVHTIVIFLSSISALYAFGESSFIHDSYDYIFGSHKGKTNHRLKSRADDATTCDNSLTSKMFTRFSGIFFGDFTTRNGQDILGPLAVRGTFSGSVYTINANGAVNCSDIEHNFDGYGLVVEGSYNGASARVHGAIFLPYGTDTSKIQELNSNCPIVTDRGTGLFDFERAYINSVYASQKFAALEPNLKLDENDVFVRLGPKIGHFDVMTLNTCNNFNCNLYPGKLSYPNHMINGVGNWNGPRELSFPENLIINIPVSVGTTFTIAGNQPSLGISACNTIYNFYPSDANGIYTPGRIYINRNTGGQLGGFTLAPDANIEEAGTGNFAGLVVANDYVWKQGTGGVELHDYAAVGGRCFGFTGCFPIFNDSDPLFPELVVIPPETSLLTFSTIFSEPTTSILTTYSTLTDDMNPSNTITYSTITEDLGSTVTFSTITETPSDTVLYSTITDDTSDTMKTNTEDLSDTTISHSIITENPSDTITYSVITEDPSNTITYSVITEDPSNTITYSTITEDPSNTITYSVITEDPSNTITYSTITEDLSNTMTYSTITGFPDDTITYSTIIDVTTYNTISKTSGNTIIHSTITDVPTTTLTYDTIIVITSSSVVVTITLEPEVTPRSVSSTTISSSNRPVQTTSVYVPTSSTKLTSVTNTQYDTEYTNYDDYTTYHWDDKHKSKYVKSNKHKGHKHGDDEECDEEEEIYDDYNDYDY